ncbi:MAG: hypothetical protein GF320_18095 [Armatimonadia bacterium]|nr:hypothetical protein [Armatimonadia bacterium]
MIRRIGLGDHLLEWDVRARSSCWVGPRWWIKVRYDGGGPSQYFSVSPGLTDPAPFIERFVGVTGTPWTSELRRAVGELGRLRQTTWGLALKWTGDQPKPRIIGRVSRARLPSLLADLGLEIGVTEAYARWNRSLGGSAWCYVSVDASGAVASVDFEAVPSSEVPFAAADVFDGTLGAGPLPYLKCRVASGGQCAWTVYAPLAEVLGTADLVASDR